MDHAPASPSREHNWQALEGEDEIRLITVLPARDDDGQVRCQIEHFNIGDAYHCEKYQRRAALVSNNEDDSRRNWSNYSRDQTGQVPADDWIDVGLLVDDATKHLPLPRYAWGDYLALSYTWGGPYNTREIIVNDFPIAVTENLEQALRTLRDRPYIWDGWKLWIDALCINQQDIIERATQVKKMRNVYSRSWTPLIWLGIEADDSRLSIDLIRQLAAMHGRPNVVVELTAMLRRNPLLFGAGAWRALHQLVVRRYWRRAWILQEAALGRSNMPVLCGQETLPWNDVRRALDIVNMTDEVINVYIAKEVANAGLALDIEIWHSLFVVGEIHKLQSQQLGSQPINLYRIMSLSRNVYATDPRDKIYGLLAMLPKDITSLIAPDYMAPVTEIYLDFAKMAITATKSFEIVRHVSYWSTLNLPSWVPDWTAEHKMSSLTLSNTLHRAAGTSSAQARFLPGGKLAAKGLKVDAPDGLGCRWEGGWPLKSVQQSKQSINPYGSRAAVAEAIWRSMVADRDIYVEPLKDDYSSLLASILIAEAGTRLPDDDPLKDVATSNILDWSAKFLRGNAEFMVCGRPLKEYLPIKLSEVKKSIDAAVLRNALVARDRINVRRRLLTTRRGFVGMVLEEVEMSDIIAVLMGCSMPMVLRPDADSCYRVVGECYIHGLMNGEAMTLLENGQCEVEEFVLT